MYSLKDYEREEYRIRTEKHKSEFFIAERNYQSQLSIANKKRLDYNNRKELFLKEMQEYETFFNKNIKETLLKFNIDLEECYQDNIWENKTLKNVKKI